MRWIVAVTRRRPVAPATVTSGPSARARKSTQWDAPASTVAMVSLRSPMENHGSGMESRMTLPSAPPADARAGQAAATAPPGHDLPFDAVLSFAADGTISDFDAGAERLFGWRRDQAIGHGLGERLFHGELQRRFLADLVRQFEGVEPLPQGRRIELVASRADGSRVPVELAVSCLGDA